MTGYKIQDCRSDSRNGFLRYYLEYVKYMEYPCWIKENDLDSFYLYVGDGRGPEVLIIPNDMLDYVSFFAKKAA